MKSSNFGTTKKNFTSPRTNQNEEVDSVRDQEKLSEWSQQFLTTTEIIDFDRNKPQ